MMFLELDWSTITKTLVFIINAIGIVLIFLVYFSDTKNKLNKIFVATTFLMLIWVDFAFLARLEGQVQRSLFWIRIAWSITPLLFSLLYFFIIYFFKLGKKYRFLDLFNIFLAVFFIIITLFTNFIIENIKFTNRVATIDYGNLVFLFFGTVFYLTILNFALLLKRYFKSSDIKEKVKIKYLLFGLFFFFIMNSIFNIVLPFFLGIVHLYEFGDYSTIFFLSIIAYIIVKKELFGIRVVITSAVVSLITILFILDMLVFTSDLMIRLYKALVIVVFFYFGYLLIRSVLREIKMREQIAKAYEVEKRARKELARLDDVKNQFIMASQHHLRTPLTSMQGYIDLLFGGTYGEIPLKIKETLLKFQLSIKRLIRIINEFLDITQFQLGKEVVMLQPGVEIEPILEEVIEELQLETKAKGLYLKFEKPKKITKIKADSEKLKIALFNIVDNGIKYTQKGGVTIKVEVADSKIRIITKDTGAGIAKEDLKGLFGKLFERGQEARKVHGTGRGIGLYITSHIIKAHKGKIWAESEGKGRGSTFFVELPVE